MINKLVAIFMVAMLGLNFFAWNKITVKNDNTIQEIYRILDSCESK